MLSETVGLTLVEEELLPRASVTMAELIDILKTRFFNGRLALTNADGSAVFSGKVKDLRLRHPSKDNPRGLLTVEDCHALQSFIRLWRKSKWSLDELDFALSVFGNRLSPDSAPRIDIQTIIAIAAVQQISQLVGVQISRLLPLWSILDTAGEQSIYRSMFLRVVKPTPVFGSDGNGGMFETEAKISETLPALSAALGLPSGSLGALVEATGVLDDALNPGSLSALYRSSLFCSMMELDPIHYGELLKMLGNGISPFKDPQTTLRIISQWRRLKSAGIDLAQLKRISGIGSVAPISPDATICDAAKATFALLKDLDSVEQLVPETRDSSAEEVRRIASMLFDPSTAKRVVAFVEGLWSNSSRPSTFG